MRGLATSEDRFAVVLEVYDELMDRALRVRGASRAELMQRLASTGSPVEA